jgi:hypothetical protein
MDQLSLNVRRCQDSTLNGTPNLCQSRYVSADFCEGLPLASVGNTARRTFPNARWPQNVRSAVGKVSTKTCNRHATSSSRPTSKDLETSHQIDRGLTPDDTTADSGAFEASLTALGSTPPPSRARTASPIACATAPTATRCARTSRPSARYTRGSPAGCWTCSPEGQAFRLRAPRPRSSGLPDRTAQSEHAGQVTARSPEPDQAVARRRCRRGSDRSRDQFALDKDQRPIQRPPQCRSQRFPTVNDHAEEPLTQAAPVHDRPETRIHDATGIQTPSAPSPVCADCGEGLRHRSDRPRRCRQVLCSWRIRGLLDRPPRVLPPCWRRHLRPGVHVAPYVR